MIFDPQRSRKKNILFFSTTQDLSNRGLKFENIAKNTTFCQDFTVKNRVFCYVLKLQSANRGVLSGRKKSKKIYRVLRWSNTLKK